MFRTGTDIELAASILRSGDVVVIPTETVYGLSANAFNPEAVKKIFAIKKRPLFNPLIVHSDSLTKVEQYVAEFPLKAKKLSEKFWPGPLTIVLKKSNIISEIVTGGNSTVAVRIPNHPLTIALLKLLDFPLAAPSANPFGFISPTTPQHVEEQLGDKIKYILDGGKCMVGIESTIIGFFEDEPEILRFGGISIEDIEAIIGKVKIKNNDFLENPIAPGQLKSHYAPKHKLIFGDLEKMIKKGDYNPVKIGILSFSNLYPMIPQENQIRLSKNLDLNEAAGNLFDSLRKLDKLDIEVIFAEEFPNRELGRAINDRLTRASAERY